MEIVTGKRAMTRLTIIRAARRLFEEKGIEKTSFTEIAEAAGVSRSTVFNYFSSTSQLLTALCSREVEDLEEAYRKSGCSGRDGIIAIFDAFIEDTAMYPRLVARIIFTALMNESEYNPLRMIEELIGRNLAADKEKKRTRQRHKTGARQEKRKTQTDEEITVLLMGAYYGLINHYHIHGRDFDAERMKQEMRRMICSIIP